MSSRVDQPSDVKGKGIAETASVQESSQGALVPTKDGDKSWDKEAHEEVEVRVESVLEGDNRVFKKIINLDLLHSLDTLGVALNKQPSNMRVEESTISVVRVSISVTVLVMDAVISAPMEQ